MATPPEGPDLPRPPPGATTERPLSGPAGRAGRYVLQGAGMGLAESVPGVSGGTIALILGIYDRFITAISNIGTSTVERLLRAGSAQGRRALRQHLLDADAPFLAWLGLGMVAALLVAAHGVGWLLHNIPIVMMGLFLGLIVASARLPWRLVPEPDGRAYVAVVIGIAVAAALTFSTPGGLPVTWPMLFVGGVAAVSVMLVPGVSGQSLLLLLGLYEAVLAAVRELHWSRLSAVALGGVVAVVVTSRLLRDLLHRAPRPTLSLITGLMLGSGLRLWPWRSEAGFAQGQPILPGLDAAITMGLVGIAAGVLLSYALERAGATGQRPRAKTA